jgi:heavy metal sensor kinase
MSSKKKPRLRGTLALRLTLWYTGTFAISILVAFLVYYLLIASVIRERRDRDLSDDVEEFSMMLAAEGMDRVKAEMAWETASDGVESVFLRLLSPGGEELVSTDMSSWGRIVPDNQALEQLKSGTGPYLETLAIPGHEYRVRTVYGFIGPDTILQIGESLEEDAEFLEMMRAVFPPIIAAMTIVAAIIGWLMARRALTDVEKVTQTALQISRGALDRRVPIKARGDEIERLATAFNHMLDRIGGLIREMSEMNDSIAHDLRSPLARIRGAAEMALTTKSSIDEHKAIAASMIEECDRLLGMITTMLDIAEAESGTAKLALEEVDLVRVIQGACEIFQAIAEDNSIEMRAELPDNCVVHGEPRKLQRMVANLLDNALKYTPPEGTVAVSVNETNADVAISVRDTGGGISEKDLLHVFRKFYRCDRSRAEHGTGLGLSLVMAIAHSHGGGNCPFPRWGCRRHESAW